MKMKYLIIIICMLCVPLTACFLASFGPLPMDVNRKNDYLRNKEGNIVDDCNGSSLSKDSEKTDYFWDKNNLPHGTVYFKCVGGKAYLPKDAPPGADDRSTRRPWTP